MLWLVLLTVAMAIVMFGIIFLFEKVFKINCKETKEEKKSNKRVNDTDLNSKEKNNNY